MEESEGAEAVRGWRVTLSKAYDRINRFITDVDARANTRDAVDLLRTWYEAYERLMLYIGSVAVGIVVFTVTFLLKDYVSGAYANKVQSADLVIRNANVITVDSHFSQAEAVAVAGDKILLVGDDREISRLVGPNTRVIDAKGMTVLPGLCDSHVHSYRASVSEFGAPMPILNSLAEAFRYNTIGVRSPAANTRS